MADDHLGKMTGLDVNVTTATTVILPISKADCIY